MLDRRNDSDKRAQRELRDAQLTEREIMIQVAAGRLNKQIVGDSNPRHVYRTNSMRNMQVRSLPGPQPNGEPPKAGTTSVPTCLSIPHGC